VSRVKMHTEYRGLLA